MPWSGKERRKPDKPGRRHYDGTCLLHNVTCEQIIDTEEAINLMRENMATKEDVEKNYKFLRMLITLFIAGTVTILSTVGGFGLYKLWDIAEKINTNSANLVILMDDFGIRAYKSNPHDKNEH